MKKICIIIITILFFSTAAYAKEKQESSAASLSASVAKVNGEDITRAEVERAIDILAPRTYFHASITPEKRKKLEGKALDDVIERKLLYQYAKKIGIKATEKEIKEYEKRVAGKLKDKKSFIAALNNANMSYETFRKELEVDLTLRKLFDTKIKKTYSDAELKEYYEKNKFKFKEPEKIKVRIVYIRNDPTDPDGKSKALKKAKEAYKKIKDGEKFADIAYKYSDAMSRVKGGDVGYTHRGMLDSDIDKVAFSLKEGEISEIIENDKGYYIINVEEKKVQRMIAFEDTVDRLRKSLNSKIEKERKESLLDKLKKDAVIER